MKHFLNKYLLRLIGVLVFGILIYFFTLETDTYMGRWFKWQASDIEDYQKFPAFQFKASNQPYIYITKLQEGLDTLKVSIKENSKKHLLEILNNSGTTAFLIIKNDTLIYERYLNKYKRNSINTSFSVAKSITALLVGKAIDDQLISSIQDSIVTYLPQLKNIDTNYKYLTLQHLLEMKSGLQFIDHDLPWGDKPKAYYHPNLRERIFELPFKYKPGTTFQYNSYNPILTGMLLEKVTHNPAAVYFEKSIWNDMGMEFEGSWSMDSENSRMTKMESGLNLTAIDFAKFGSLMLHKGYWNNKQIISKDWIDSYFSVSKEYQVIDFGNEIYYKNYWWLISKDGEKPYIISGWGHLGQFLYVFPDKNIVIVRMGKKLGNVASWNQLINEIAISINP